MCWGSAANMEMLSQYSFAEGSVMPIAKYVTSRSCDTTQQADLTFQGAGVMYKE